ncbi:hypothetical protein EJB05_30581, partial [Eragrostis curvula]
MAIKLISKCSFHLEKSRSAITATTNDCTVLNTHCVTVTTILFGYSLSTAVCTANPQEQTAVQLWYSVHAVEGPKFDFMTCKTIQRDHTKIERIIRNVHIIHNPLPTIAFELAGWEEKAR